MQFSEANNIANILAVFDRSTSKVVEWWEKKRAKRIKNVLQCPMC